MRVSSVAEVVEAQYYRTIMKRKPIYGYKALYLIVVFYWNKVPLVV
jgi:hypothetical protein